LILFNILPFPVKNQTHAVSMLNAYNLSSKFLEYISGNVPDRVMPYNRIILPNIDNSSGDNYKARILKSIAITNYGRSLALDRAMTY
jgi:hypothetical protein